MISVQKMSTWHSTRTLEDVIRRYIFASCLITFDATTLCVHAADRPTATTVNNFSCIIFVRLIKLNDANSETEPELECSRRLKNRNRHTLYRVSQTVVAGVFCSETAWALNIKFYSVYAPTFFAK